MKKNATVKKDETEQLRRRKKDIARAKATFDKKSKKKQEKINRNLV